jgi:GntR family transcriptional regulator
MNEAGDDIMLERNSSVPLWEQLDAILREKIDNGVWKTGEMIDSENELSKEYNISRMTVRNVILRLVQEGLLYRVPGKGTFIKEPKIPTKPLSYMGISEQLEKEGMQIRTEVIENKVTMPSERIAKKLEIENTQAVYYIERVRYIKEKPLSIHRTYLKQLMNPLIDEERLMKDQLCNILEDDYNLVPTLIKETLELVYATVDQAKKLELEEGQPLLYLKNQRLINQKVMEFTEVFFRGDQIRISFEYDGVSKRLG